MTLSVSSFISVYYTFNAFEWNQSLKLYGWLNFFLDHPLSIFLLLSLNLKDNWRMTLDLKLTHVRNIHWWAPGAPPPSPWRSQKSKINWTHESWVEEWPPQVDAQNFRIIHHLIPSLNLTQPKSSIKYSAVWLTFYCLQLQNTKLHSCSVTLND